MASCWKVLDLEPTNDERAILRAYAKALKTCRPDENPEGFQRLVEAREQALQQARIVVQPVVQVNRLEDENLNEDEDAGNDDALPVITPPDVEAVEPIDTAPIAPQEPDPNEQLLEDVLKRLDETMSSSAPWSAPGRNVAAWIDLFDLAAGLDFNAMQRFRKVVASNLVRVFPDEAAAGDSDVAGLKAGTGILALAELIESECQFSWHGMRLASLAGTVGAERYFFWQARTKAACDLLARLAIPGLLKDTATGMPVLPEEDKPVLLVRKELKDYTDAAAHRARKPFSPDWLAMIFPVRRLFYYGMSREALGMLTLGGVLCLFLLRHSDMAFGIYGGLIAGYFALCAFLAYDIKWLGLKTMAGYVTRADRLHLLGSKRRAALAAANIISPKASFAAILEFLVFGCLLALLLFGFASHSTNRRFDVRSVPETLDGQMIELMEKTARGRFVPTSAFFNLLQDHLAQRANIDALGHTVSVNDVSPLEKSRILSTGSDIATLAGDKGDLRLMSLSLTVERAHKLEALLADYIAAPEQGRREIEQRLARWRVPILAAGGDYRLEAVLWSVMPPRRDKDDEVVSIVDELRRAALISFIDRTQAQLNRKGIFDERGVIERLDRILTASGEELLNAARSFENGAVSEFSILPYVASDTAALPTDRMSSLLSANSDLADVVKGWAEPVLSWRIFATTVRTCLNLGDAGERAVINALIEPEIAAARLTGVADGTDLWAALTMKVTSEPACRAYLAGASPGNSTDSEKGSALGPQLGQLYGDNRVDEARRLARFMVGAASSKDFMWSTSDRGAVVLHWQRITEHQTAMAIEHIDQMSAGALDCPALALRGYALKSASEDRAARAEFVAALSAVQDDKCSSTYRNGLIFDVNQLRAEKKELEKKLAGGF